LQAAVGIFSAAMWAGSAWLQGRAVDVFALEEPLVRVVKKIHVCR
jgi:hypothetical protein